MNYLIFISIYVFVSISLYRIAKRLNAPHPWMAAFPILREWLLVSMAEKSWKWFVCILVPIVNIVGAWVVWGNVSRKIGRSAWTGRLMVFPLVNILLIWILAFDITVSDVRRWCMTLLKWLRAKISRQSNMSGETGKVLGSE
jgi:hypothetical protein